MRRLLLTGLFVIGLVWAVISYPGLAKQGEYQSIVLDFSEELTAAQVNDPLQTYL